MKNLIFITLPALFLGFIAANAQNPEQPSPGNYYIVNSVPSPKGDKLAATFQDGQSNVFVTPLNGSEVQKWSITLGSQFILPVTKQSVAATAQNSAVVILPKNGFVWTIRNLTTTQNYTIADQSQYWDLNSAVENGNIVLAARASSSLTQSWVLELVK